MGSPLPATDLALLTQAAQSAGPIALAYTKDALNITDKGDGQGPVTAADHSVNAHLLDTLRTARPDYGWLSEETTDDSTRLNDQTIFVVDPIDGTRAFIEGSANWAHALAVVDRGTVTAAAVHLPAKDLLYTAALGQGAFLNGAPIAVSKTTDLAKATVLTAAKPTLKPENWRITPPFKTTFRSSLAYRLCLVAQGRFDAMITLRDAWDWDIAAGALIVAEAGGTVTGRAGEPLSFNTLPPQSPGTIAANPRIHQAIRAHQPA